MEDRAVVRQGHGQEADTRQSTVDGMVDIGAVTLVLLRNGVEPLAVGAATEMTSFW